MSFPADDDVFPLKKKAIDPATSGLNDHAAAAPCVPQPGSEPGSEPVLASVQRLSHISPQPDRLVAVMSAPVPLIEAARPLLEALTRMSGKTDAASLAMRHGALIHEVAAFQSVCQDARFPYEDIVAASYMLCTALDDVATHSAWSKANEFNAQPWTGQLATHVHGDSRGGSGVFRILGYMLNAPQRHIDLLELMLIILALGFKGTYRNAPKGQRLLDRIKERIYSVVYAGRGAIPSPRWLSIERLLKDDDFADVFSKNASALF
jgi:type VI secretion system protein ImpK